jgi:hypothetical protein
MRPSLTLTSMYHPLDDLGCNTEIMDLAVLVSPRCESRQESPIVKRLMCSEMKHRFEVIGTKKHGGDKDFKGIGREVYLRKHCLEPERVTINMGVVIGREPSLDPVLVKWHDLNLGQEVINRMKLHQYVEKKVLSAARS